MKIVLCTTYSIQSYIVHHPSTGTLICMLSTIEILYYASVTLCTTCLCSVVCSRDPPNTDKTCPFCVFSMWTTKKKKKKERKMLGLTPTSRSLFCTMVHNADRWCIMLVGGAQRSSYKSRQTEKWKTDATKWIISLVLRSIISIKV